MLLDRRLSRPVLRYVGGKWAVASWVIEQFPPHECYVEPFCGAANILLRKPPSAIEVLNDLNGEIVNFFEVLRTRTQDLVQAIQLTPYSRQVYYHAHSPDLPTDPLERALRLYIRSWQGFGMGMKKYRDGWRVQRSLKDHASVVERDWNETAHLWEVADRLKQVMLEHDHAFQVIPRFDAPHTLFYVDPPYVMATRSEKGGRYSHEMSDDEHRALASLLHRVKGMVILSGYACPLYQELYPTWTRLDKTVTTNNGGAALESLWLSPTATHLAHLPLFGGLT